MGRPLQIAIGVHGRFHAFDVAKALHQLGQQVTLHTNYPAFAVQRFGLEGIRLKSFALHGLITRGLGRIGQGKLLTRLESAMHQGFGKWLAGQVSHQPYDVIDLYSGIAEETLQRRQQGDVGGVCLLERGSAHIRLQSQLLQEEEARTQTSQDQPSAWMMAREEREYAATDHINVLSTFAHRSFEVMGIPAEKLTVTPLGVDIQHFRAEERTIQQRQARILAGEPLQVLYVGRVGYQKGFWDFADVIAQVSPDKFRFAFVGGVMAEVETRRAALPPSVQFVGHQPQNSLPHWYTQGDIFLYPTIQDGFAMVLAQAQAAGLPIIATTNCSAPDFLEEGKSGWIVPIRAPEQIVEQLQWCDTHRTALAEMVAYTHRHPYVRDWREVGQDYLTLMQRLVAQR